MSPTKKTKRTIYPGPVGLRHYIGALLYRRRIQKQIVREAKKRLEAQIPLRLVVGAGSDEGLIAPVGSQHEGWFLTDHATLNALKVSEWKRVFRDSSLSNIVAEHVVEHFTTEQFRTFLAIASRFLRPGGNLRIAVPDGFHPNDAYLEHVKPGGIGPGSEGHKVLYNYKTLTKILDEENWHYDLLEYFDESHEFNAKSWEPGAGFVGRSQQNDPRNKINPLAYTSLIVDSHFKTPSCSRSVCFQTSPVGSVKESGS